jgi:Arc/MetJ family transcription regulator
MRTNIEIDDELLKTVMEGSGIRTKREAVDLALRTLARLHAQEGIRRLRGKVHWEGDLNESRLGRFQD